MLVRICQWLQHNGFIVFVNSSVVTAPSLEIIHFFSFFVLVGSLVAVDLRILGLAARKMRPGSLVKYAFPWMWGGFIVAVISGFLMFAIDATEYCPQHRYFMKTLLPFVYLDFRDRHSEKCGEVGSFAADSGFRQTDRPSMPDFRDGHDSDGCERAGTYGRGLEKIV